MRLLNLIPDRPHYKQKNKKSARAKSQGKSRYKRALMELQAIPSFSRYPDVADRAVESLKWGKKHLTKSDRFDWLTGIWKRYLHFLGDPDEGSRRQRIMDKYPQARILGDIQAFHEVFYYAFPAIQGHAKQSGCRVILDMPFFEKENGRAMPLSPDVVIDRLENLEDKYLTDYLASNRFCTEGEPYLETHDGWKWFRIRPGRSREEGEAMRHCGNVPGWCFGDFIYSLREPVDKKGKTFWKPHMTIVCNGLRFRELKGFSNRKPAADFHPHIVDLLGQKKFRGFSRPGYCPKNDFHVCDLSEDHVRELFRLNPSLDQDGLDWHSETVCNLSNGWRWVFIANTDVQGYCRNLSTQGVGSLWSLKGRRGWHILQEPVNVGGSIHWVHRLVLGTRDKCVLGIVRAGEKIDENISFGLLYFLKFHAKGLYYFDLFRMLSVSDRDEVLKATPTLLNHFHPETVMELAPPVCVIEAYLKWTLPIDFHIENERTLVLKEFVSRKELLEYLCFYDQWKERVAKLSDHDGLAATVFVKHLSFRLDGLTVNISRDSGIKLIYPIKGIISLLVGLSHLNDQKTRKSIMEWILRPGMDIVPSANSLI
ncbi:MAG: hypothetical protein HN996_04895 [Opitutae bacterium]|nr:hypothetical protein [Opitutae bacterium]